MTLRLTKQQLKAVQEKREHVNSDSGKVFVGVRGRRHKEDGLWHLEVIERPISGGESSPSFSLKSVIGTPSRPPLAEAVANDPTKNKPSAAKADK